MVTARVGVVGAGWWCTRVHLPSIASYDRANLIGIADLDLDRARLAAETFGGEPVGSLTELIALGIDVLVIATTHETHFPLAAQAIEAGIDVLIEKPMVVDPAEGRELVRLAKERGTRIHVGYPYPHSTHAQQARRAIRDGTIGEIHLIASMFSTSAGILYQDLPRFDAPDDALIGPDPATYRDAASGGQARGQMTHSISAMLFVTDATPTSINAYVRTLDVDVDVVDSGTFTTDEFAIGTVASTGALPIGAAPMERLEIYGSNGHIQYGMSAGTLTTTTPEGVSTATSVEGHDRYPEQVPARHLVDCFLDNTTPLVDGALGVRTASFIDALLRSAEHGTEETIDYYERKPT